MCSYYIGGFTKSGFLRWFDLEIQNLGRFFGVVYRANFRLDLYCEFQGMGGDSRAVNGYDERSVDSAAAGEVGDHRNGEDDSESNALLPPRRGGMSRKSNKPRMKVRWNDSNGNNLAEILEFQPR